MWTAELEVNLFNALRGHKPTGINRHFHMACVHRKLLQSCTDDKNNITSENVWQHLYKMFNLDALNELDELPFNNVQRDFQLPEEITNPELMSAPGSPIAMETETSAAARPNNLNLAAAKNNSSPTPSEVTSPKRKRNSRQAQLTSSQPSSPATPTPKRRR